MSTVLLYVEDNPMDRLLMQLACRRGAPLLNLQMVADGETAIRYLSGEGPYANREAHPMPDLVLLDLKLAGMDGIDVLRWIRARPTLASLPVALLTSSFDPEDVEKAEAAGADFYLTKPADLKRLEQLARVILHDGMAKLRPAISVLTELPECVRYWSRMPKDRVA